MALTAAEIDNAKDLPTKLLPVPEWGGDVRIRTLPCEERDDLEVESMLQKDAAVRMKNFRARLVALCLVDDNGNRLYPAEGVARLAKRSGRVLDRVFDECLAFNGMDKKAVENAEKNSASGPASASSSS